VTWLYRFDMGVFRTVHVGWHSSFLDPIFWAFSYSGLGQVQFLISLLFLRGKETKHYVLPLLVTILVAGIPVAQLVKVLVPRDRPSNLFLAVPQEEFYAKSFPSGHTTTAFAVAAMLFLVTWGSRNAWLGRTAVLWAFLVGVSRVYRGVHWPTDAAAGACAGVFSACLVYLVLRKLGHTLHLDQPEATLSGQEVGREPGQH
jgi:undecaprenyl-diphosphatase